MVHILKRIKNMEPLSKIFWISLIVVFLSAFLTPLRYVAVIAAVILVVFVVYFIAWFNDR